jgi:hypothetical protein
MYKDMLVQANDKQLAFAYETEVHVITGFLRATQCIKLITISHAVRSAYLLFPISPPPFFTSTTPQHPR